MRVMGNPKHTYLLPKERIPFKETIATLKLWLLLNDHLNYLSKWVENYNYTTLPGITRGNILIFIFTDVKLTAPDAVRVRRSFKKKISPHNPLITSC